MINQIAIQDAPKDDRTGLTLPLSRFLGSRDLAQHRAMVAVELEVIAKKFDRFGWDRDRGSASHDRMITDWMDALQDYPLDEVRAACKAAVLENPSKMPNEGHVVEQIKKARREWLALNPPRCEPECHFNANSVPVEERRAFAKATLERVGFKPKTFGERAAK